MYMDTKTKILLFLLREGPKRWSDINKKLDISEPTLFRNLKEIATEGSIIKKIDEHGHIVYEINKLFNIPEIKPAKLIKYNETLLHRIEKLEKGGFFSKGINYDDILVFLKEEKIGMLDRINEFIKKSDKPNIYSMNEFFQFLLFAFSIDTELTGTIKVDVDVNDFRKRLRKSIQELKKMNKKKGVFEQKAK